MESNIRLHPSWLQVLGEEFTQPYFKKLKEFIVEEKSGGEIIYPPGNRIFAALDETPFDKVKVVILGQDPYHGEGQANGLCFSVNRGMTTPPSLKNIYKELASDIGFQPPSHGDLNHWAYQGVLLLNAVLTVRANLPASHQNKGWEIFTDAIIKKLSAERSNLVFLFWGAFARSKKTLIDNQRHLILEAAHPSPFSVTGFFGCRHFSKTNAYLLQHGMEAIDWSLTS